MKVSGDDLVGGSYARPLPVSSGSVSRPVPEGPRTPYRGYTYTLQYSGREWIWRVYNEMGDSGELMTSGSVVTGPGNSIAAEQSAKDWIDNYIDSLTPPPPQDDDLLVDDDEVVIDDGDDVVIDDGDDVVIDDGDGGESGSEISPEFVLLGALAFLGLAIIFVFDGED